MWASRVLVCGKMCGDSYGIFPSVYLGNQFSGLCVNPSRYRGMIFSLFEGKLEPWTHGKIGQVWDEVDELRAPKPAL